MNYNDPFIAVSTNLLSSIQSRLISILLIDDQAIIAEALRRMLGDQKDMIVHYCSDPSRALSMAAEIHPTIILQDLVMPEFDGLTLVKYFRANPATHDIPIIVLSTKEDPKIKAEAFSLGVHDYIVKLPDPVELIARIRYHSNSYTRLLERNEAFNKLEENQKILQSELAEAAAYVRSLLPPLLDDKMKTDWKFIPSTQLGGDAFGYHWLDERFFAVYLLDVCGHGVGAALHSISVANVLRSQSLPKADFYNPSSVLAALNLGFQMELHNNMFFTIWYGVYDKEKKEITYSSGGHPPAILFSGETEKAAKIYELKTPGIVIGALPIGEFQNATCKIQPYSKLYIFSDGVYEIRNVGGIMLEFHEFIDLLKKAHKEGTELNEIVETIQKIQGKTIFPDDFSIVQITFPS